MLKRIKKIEQVEPFKLTLQFGDGSVRIVDLEENFRAKSTSPESLYPVRLISADFCERKWTIS